MVTARRRLQHHPSVIENEADRSTRAPFSLAGTFILSFRSSRLLVPPLSSPPPKSQYLLATSCLVSVSLVPFALAPVALCLYPPSRPSCSTFFPHPRCVFVRVDAQSKRPVSSRTVERTREKIAPTVMRLKRIRPSWTPIKLDLQLRLSDALLPCATRRLDHGYPGSRQYVSHH